MDYFKQGKWVQDLYMAQILEYAPSGLDTFLHFGWGWPEDAFTSGVQFMVYPNSPSISTL